MLKVLRSHRRSGTGWLEGAPVGFFFFFSGGRFDSRAHAIQRCEEELAAALVQKLRCFVFADGGRMK